MVFEKLRAILCDQFDVEESEVTMESNILEDFNADSLDFIDLIMTVEDEFELEVPDDQVEGIKTVGDVVRYIEERQ